MGFAYTTIKKTFLKQSFAVSLMQSFDYTLKTIVLRNVQKPSGWRAASEY